MSNVTVSLPDELVREARHLAVDEGLSLSRFVARALEQRVAATKGHQAARERQLRLLRAGLPLGTRGHPPAPRATLHER